MKLYYMPGACSLVIHIALREAGVTPQLVKLNPQTGDTDDGGNIKTINAKGYVPVLVDEDGEKHTEVVAISLMLADKFGESKLLPADPKQRRRAIEWLAFVSTEIHKLFGPFFVPDATDADRKAALVKIEKQFDYADKYLDGKNGFLFSDEFTVADIYLFVTLFWTTPAQISLEKWPNLGAFVGRGMQRPAVLEAIKAEGLI